MADFGCGAHLSNLGIAAWSDGAAIWKFLRVLQSRNYHQSPMAIPGATSGRFYLECYPHPAILGLFDLRRILKYKVDRKSPDDWRTLVGLLRSLASAELPIGNISTFVQDDLRQSKENEDKLDSIISAYVAAYWWRFGVQRSTVIGDLLTGYMVTPQSGRTLAALARVFRGSMNLQGVVDPLEAAPALPKSIGGPGEGRWREPLSEDSGASGTLPRCDWVYFATPARWSGTVTKDFVTEQNVIVRSVYNSAGLRIANVQHLKAGERILLVHGGNGRPYHALFDSVISVAALPVRSSQHCFDVFSYIEETLHARLEEGGYVLDPVVGRFTGITITNVHDLRYLNCIIPRPSGNNTIWRWEEVFSR